MDTQDPESRERSGPGRKPNPLSVRLGASTWYEGLILDIEAVNPNALEDKLEPWLFHRDQEGRRHGSGKYRNYQLGKNAPGDKTVKLAAKHAPGSEQRLNFLVNRFFGDSEPTAAEHAAIFEALSPPLKCYALHFLADLNDPLATSKQLEIHTKTIRLEDGPDALACLLWLIMTVRDLNNVEALGHIRRETLAHYANLSMIPPFRTSINLVLPILVQRYLDSPHDPDWDCGIWVGMFWLTRALSGRLAQILTLVGLLEPSPPARHAFLLEITKNDILTEHINYIDGIEDGAIATDDMDRIEEPLRTWLYIARDYLRALRVHARSLAGRNPERARKFVGRYGLDWKVPS